jgi:CHAT domain-containing protein
MQMGDGFNWQRKAAHLGRTMLPEFPAIPDRPRLIVIPDEHLHLVPFDVLVTNKGEALGQQFRLSFTQSWRDIDDLIPTRGIGETPVCIGDPDFSMAEAMHCLDESFWDTRLGAIWQALGRHPFTEFETDGVRSEIEEVASIIGVAPLTGREATATELKRLNAPGILHISTHGFYVGQEQIREHLAGMVQVRHDPNTGTKSDVHLDLLFQNPQNRSGLVFAGANLHLEGKQGHPMLDEGFVFASEIEAIDLRHTELVTLSACVTGAGDEVKGDGIAGVRRAFFAAGDASVVSTIWDVPVDSTRDLFVRFYEGLKVGLSREEALEEAKAAIAEAYPGEHYRHCGFQLYGAIGPIDHFLTPDRLIVAHVSPQDEIEETAEYRLFLEELDRIGIDLDSSNLSLNTSLRMAYRKGIWSIACLKALSEDETISSNDRDRFGAVLHEVQTFLGCRDEVGSQ